MCHIRESALQDLTQNKRIVRFQAVTIITRIGIVSTRPITASNNSHESAEYFIPVVLCTSVNSDAVSEKLNNRFCLLEGLSKVFNNGSYYTMLSCASREPPVLGERLTGSTGTQSTDKTSSGTAPALIIHEYYCSAAILCEFLRYPTALTPQRSYSYNCVARLWMALIFTLSLRR